jgi:xanthine/CO dehydrogenase XdhC/CoxF family maturation factor
VTDFRDICAAAEALAGPAALATLVRVKGSSYRQPGARMLFGPEGLRAGVLSAGCLENDILARVQTVLDSRVPYLAGYDLGSELDLVWGTGMGCAGKADVLLERLGPGLPGWMARLRAMQDQRRTGVLATVFASRGQGHPEPGTHILYDPQGPAAPGMAADPATRIATEQPVGTAAEHTAGEAVIQLAGTADAHPAGEAAIQLAGTADAHAAAGAADPFSAALAAAQSRVLATGRAAAFSLPAADGERDVLVEPVLPVFALWIFGAGEHARPMARIAKELGWFLGIVDHRPALATAERFPGADRIVVGHPPEVLRGLPLDRRSAALVVSHIYEKDRQALEALLPAPLGYLGLQGNRQRSQRLLRELGAAGPIPADQLARLHAPSGLDLGAESPEGIALSMLAEIQAALAGRPGGSLRDRGGAIHL